jgi:Flp pilus assembly protein TadG
MIPKDTVSQEAGKGMYLALQRWLREQQGQTTILMAVFIGIVGIGFTAFAVDLGYLFHERRIAQAAADSAAVAAAEEYGSNESSNAQAAADAAAKLNGFDTTLATNPATVTLTTLSSGNYSNSNSSVPPNWTQATVAKPISTFFLGAFNSKLRTVGVSASAIAAQGQSSSTCVCLQGASNQALYMSNGSTLSAPTCGIVIDSNASNAIGMIGGSSLGAKTLGTVSTTWDNSSNIYGGASISASTKIVQGITTTCAPSMPTAPVDSTCSADPLNSNQGGGVSYTVGPGSKYGTTENGDMVCYTSLTIGANSDTVTLNPGIYVIDGGYLTFDSGTMKGGSGVFFYLENGASLTIQNGANVTLSAPTSGTYSGILLYQQASDTATLTIDGGTSASISGAILAPGAAVIMNNGAGASVSSEVVAQTLTMSGGGKLTATPTINLGSLGLGGVRLSQ